ncbi:ABC transporter permease [Mucilaginibacter boryungensis]|uniref:ABC transporter permease n=1 Tax=Mucilaginibacter boryungensis TaxID=768480 RepID=A0ABR9XIA8_9SPHI|nr:ABC transporter permease [Mucilaginibacter boryungensis]MBE9666937.1 ABC transporter permease [Mucilaginibacter boryungensis]
MIKNYIKTAWRGMLKNKFYTLINIIGLTIGLSVGLLILLWVQDELSFDRFNTKAPNIYRLETVGGLGQSRRIFNEDMAPIATFAKKEIPEIANAVRIAPNYLAGLFKYGEKTFSDDISVFTDPSLFSIFDFPLIKGDQHNPFPDINSVVITQKTALKYFGNSDPIGKVIVDNNKVSFRVTGVIKDFPHNSSINYGLFFPMGYLNQVAYIKNNVTYHGSSQLATMDADWHNLGYETYLLTKPGVQVNIKQIQTKLRNIHIRNKADDTDVAYLMEPLTRMHLYKSDGTDGGMATVRIFAIIAILILIIACINYVNLSTALSMLRAREVSMRKIIGAAKAQLFAQFIVETVVLYLIATILAFGLMFALMPVYNQFSGKQLIFSLSDVQVWTVIVIALIVTLAASSIYPALLLSSFDPLKALKGKISAGMGSGTFRKMLVVVQFTVSIILIIGTLIIGRQLSYIRNKNLGYDKEHVLTFFMGGVGKQYDAFKAELMKNPSITSVSRSSSNIVDVGSFTGDADWEGMPVNGNLYFHPVFVDKTFIPFFKMKLLSGQNFTGAVADSSHYILNETAVEQMGIKDPVGKKFRMGQVKGTIIGIVKDFHFNSLHKKIEPAILAYNPNIAGRIYIKTTAANTHAALEATERVWKQFDRETPFNSIFLDESFGRLYKIEQRTGALFNVFAAVAIIVSCLGLFGLATYTAQVKTKEIGIRKVLGASVGSITRMLSWDFLLLVLLSVGIAVPLAWYGMNKWLQDFAYHAKIQWWLFLLAGLSAMVIALITISFQSVKAALANPVKSLRSE